MNNRVYNFLPLFTFMLFPFVGYASWGILDMPTDRGFGPIFALNENTIFVEGNEGLWKTFDGITWVLDSTNGRPRMHPAFVYFVDDTLGFIRGERLTIDGGKTWQLADTINGHGMHTISFPPKQSSIGYGANYITSVFKTTDGGWHWEELPSFPDVYPDFNEDIRPSEICFPSDPDTGYVTADCWKRISESEIEPHQSYFKTTDGGETWVLNEEGLWNDDFNPRYIDFPENASVGYMSGGGGKLFKTTDGGATWDTVLKDRPYIVSMCFPENDQVGYVFGDSVAHKTTDGGKTWKQAVITYDSTFYECHFINDSVGFVTGHKNMPLLSMPYDPGFVLKTTDGLMGISEEDWVDVVPVKWQIVTAIGREAVLRYSELPQGFHAQVFDATGRKVDELHSSLQSGTISWGQGKPSGVYFIRPVGTNNPRSLRVVLMR